jgi:PAS domain-containing protein
MIVNLISLLPEPCFLIDTGGRILALNDAAVKLAGCAAGTLKSLNIFDLVEDPAGKFRDFLRLCAATRTLLPGVLLWKTGDGNFIAVATVGSSTLPQRANQPSCCYVAGPAMRRSPASRY